VLGEELAAADCVLEGEERGLMLSQPDTEPVLLPAEEAVEAREAEGEPVCPDTVAAPVFDVDTEEETEELAALDPDKELQLDAEGEASGDVETEMEPQALVDGTEETAAL